MNELPRASGPSADRSFPVLVAVASLLAIAAILAFIFLEIVPWKKPVRPSALALENEFLALERWLTLTGHPVRTEVMPGSDTIPQAGEGTVYVQASLFRWSKKNYDMLKPWVEGGGRLLVSLDREWDKEYSEGMAQFLADLGIGSDQFFGADGADDDGTDDDGAAPETGGAEGDGSAHDDGSTDDETAMSRGPFFDYRISFDPKEIPPDCFSLSDSRGNIRLVGVKMGEGSVTLFGSPVFMTNFNLDDAPNARLAWSLTGAEDSEGKGV
ncbi:MAG: hypothetical protein LBI85_03765, partial [Spirochaetaceae bacterium]|nr:hypothetical protein [Spirochaetaceae bacterium]